MKIMIEVSDKDIPDNVTNGDVIKSILKDCGEVVYEKNGTMTFTVGQDGWWKWWNAPYKQDSEICSEILDKKEI